MSRFKPIEMTPELRQESIDLWNQVVPENRALAAQDPTHHSRLYYEVSQDPARLDFLFSNPQGSQQSGASSPEQPSTQE